MKRKYYFNKVQTVAMLLFITSTFLYTLNSCKKDPGEYSMLTEFKDYAYFKTGTYWIYQDSVSMQQDSVAVISDTVYFKLTPEGEGRASYEEYFEYKTYSSIDSSIHPYVGFLLCNGGVDSLVCHILEVNENIEYAGGYIPLDKILFHAFMETDKFSDQLIFRETFDTKEIMNLTYSDVVRFTDKNHYFASDSGPHANLFFAKNIGLIRREINITESVWNLTEYKIVQ